MRRTGGYVVYRAEGNAPFERLTKDPVTDPFFNDEDGEAGQALYRYVVRAIDRAGKPEPPVEGGVRGAAVGTVPGFVYTPAPMSLPNRFIKTAGGGNDFRCSRPTAAA
jgi:hypothetical protein